MQEIKKILSEVEDSELRRKLLKIYNLVENEFESKPASVKHHHTEAGGLGRHIKETMNNVLNLIKIFPTELTKDEMVTVAFVHDFDKLDRYVAATGWKAKYNKFDYNNNLVFLGDTAKTISTCYKFGLKLNEGQINAIALHHGGWSSDCTGTGRAHVGSFTKAAMVLHFADMISCIEDITRCKTKREKN